MPRRRWFAACKLSWVGQSVFSYSFCFVARDGAPRNRSCSLKVSEEASFEPDIVEGKREGTCTLQGQHASRTMNLQDKDGNTRLYINAILTTICVSRPLILHHVPLLRGHLASQCNRERHREIAMAEVLRQSKLIESLLCGVLLFRMLWGHQCSGAIQGFGSCCLGREVENLHNLVSILALEHEQFLLTYQKFWRVTI